HWLGRSAAAINALWSSSAMIAVSWTVVFFLVVPVIAAPKGDAAEFRVVSVSSAHFQRAAGHDFAQCRSLASMFPAVFAKCTGPLQLGRLVFQTILRGLRFDFQRSAAISTCR